MFSKRNESSPSIVLGFILDLSPVYMESAKSMAINVARNLDYGDICFIADNKPSCKSRKGEMVGLISNYRRSAEFFLKKAMTASFKYFLESDYTLYEHLVVLSDNCSEMDIHGLTRALKLDDCYDINITFIGLGNCYNGLSNLQNIHSKFKFFYLEDVSQISEVVETNIVSGYEGQGERNGHPDETGHRSLLEPAFQDTNFWGWQALADNTASEEFPNSI